ncbi:unnamed protein product [Protopolystoma xenopodis]|uniref:Uncharacterized protein n=1 Tax=Protopolystoma xenopodis TaxID=117903 RepID=A0A3S5CK25_9PLAT|nr:unnamed protein product [Protopolystoma xenopodis]
MSLVSPERITVASSQPASKRARRFSSTCKNTCCSVATSALEPGTTGRLFCSPKRPATYRGRRRIPGLSVTTGDPKSLNVQSPDQTHPNLIHPRRALRSNLSPLPLGFVTNLSAHQQSPVTDAKLAEKFVVTKVKNNSTTSPFAGSPCYLDGANKENAGSLGRPAGRCSFGGRMPLEKPAPSPYAPLHVFKRSGSYKMSVVTPISYY